MAVQLPAIRPAQTCRELDPGQAADHAIQKHPGHLSSLPINRVEWPTAARVRHSIKMPLDYQLIC